jgi:hypothetical protein
MLGSVHTGTDADAYAEEMLVSVLELTPLRFTAFAY